MPLLNVIMSIIHVHANRFMYVYMCACIHMFAYRYCSYMCVFSHTGARSPPPCTHPRPYLAITHLWVMVPVSREHIEEVFLQTGLGAALEADVVREGPVHIC